MKNIKLGEDIAVLLFFDDARAICRYKRAGRKLTGYAAGVRADSGVFMSFLGSAFVTSKTNCYICMRTTIRLDADAD